MAVRRILLPWDSQPQGLVGANPYWVQRGLRSLYSLTPGAWQVNQVTGQVGGTAVGTGVTFPAGFLRTPGSSGNGAALETGLATNIALPITLIVGWTRISGAVSWSWLKNDAAWTGWYGEATGDIKTSNNNSFDGLVSLGASGSYAFSHVSGTSLFGAGRLAAATDTTSTAPVAVDRSSVHLGGALRGIYDNPAVAEFTYFAAFQGSLSPSELLDLVHTPGLLFAPQTIWVPVSAGGGAPTLALTGYAATGSAGILMPALSLAVTGNGATAAQGTATPSLSLATTGNTATSAAGTPVASISLALTGNGATASVGTVGIGGTTQALTGNEVTASAGTPVAAISLALTGNGVTSAAGTVTPQVSLALTGNAATTAVGTPVAGLSLAITGNAATASAGTVAVPGVIVPSSNLATTAAGTVSPGITLALTGNGATASVGSVSPAISLALSGLAGTSSAGIVIPGLSLALSGNAAAAATGTIAVATGDATVALTGNLATAYAGSLGIGGAVGLSAWWRYDVPVNDMRYAVPVHNLRYDVDTENLT